MERPVKVIKKEIKKCNLSMLMDLVNEHLPEKERIRPSYGRLFEATHNGVEVKGSLSCLLYIKLSQIFGKNIDI